jgi:UDP-glucose 4-epimerase
MNILLTGVEGFIGSNIKIYLHKKGYKIISPSLSELDFRDSLAVEKLFRNIEINCIIHSATVLQKNKLYIDTVCEDNLKMFFNLIKYKNDSCKLINLGSGSEYSRDHWIPKMDEDYFESFIPQDSHSLSKFITSKYIKDSKREDLYHLRIFGIFGPNEDYRYKFISNTIAKKNFKLPIIINKNVIYDYLYIDDFCRIIDFFIGNNTHEKIFNTTPTESSDLLNIVKIVDETFGSKSKINILKKGYGKEYTGNNLKLLSHMPNFKFTPLSESIRLLSDYYQTKKNIIDVKSLMVDNFLDYAKKINP